VPEQSGPKSDGLLYPFPWGAESPLNTLGTKVGLGHGHLGYSIGPGNIVLDGDLAPPPTRKGAQQPPLSAHVYCGQTVAYLSYELLLLCPVKGSRRR